MGFFDKLKKSILGVKEKADDAKEASARVHKTVDDLAEKGKGVKDKAENAVDK